MNARYYSVDPDSTAVNETEASTGKPAELMVDLDFGWSRTQLVSALVAITDYIGRNAPAPVVAGSEPEPPPGRPHDEAKAEAEARPWHHRSRTKS